MGSGLLHIVGWLQFPRLSGVPRLRLGGIAASGVIRGFPRTDRLSEAAPAPHPTEVPNPVYRLLRINKGFRTGHC